VSAEEGDLGRTMERIEALIEAIESSEGPATKTAARELCAAVLEIHGRGLARILDLVAAAGEPGRTLAAAFLKDDLLASLLALHDLHASAWEPRAPTGGADLDASSPRASSALEPRASASGPPRPAPPGELVPLRRSRDGESLLDSHSSGGRCELCGGPLGEPHPHLFEPAARKMRCACGPCSLLLGHRGDPRYRNVPRRLLYLDGFRMTDAAWDELGVPVHLAFFFRSSAEAKVVALYPSPAGTTESLLPLAAWDDLAADNPVLSAMEPDVEALLVHRVEGAREHFLVPIDRCFELAGLMRARRGALFGGGGVPEDVIRFLARLKEEARA
jgi:hypothetical protein